MKKNPIVIGALDKVGVKPKHFFALADVLFEPAEPPTDVACGLNFRKLETNFNGLGGIVAPGAAFAVLLP